MRQETHFIHILVHTLQGLLYATTKKTNKIMTNIASIFCCQNDKTKKYLLIKMFYLKT